MAAPQTGRFNGLLRRMLSLKEPISPSLLEDFFPTMLLVAGTEPENMLLRDNLLFSGFARQAAVAAQFAVVQLGTVVKGFVTVVERFTVFAPAAAGITYQYGLTFSPVNGPVLTPQSKDNRHGQGAIGVGLVPACKMGIVSAVVARVETGGVGATSGTIEVDTVVGPWVIPNGWILEVGSQTVNQDMTVTFHGYERRLEPSEFPGGEF